MRRTVVSIAVAIVVLAAAITIVALTVKRGPHGPRGPIAKVSGHRHPARQPVMVSETPRRPVVVVAPQTAPSDVPKTTTHHHRHSHHHSVSPPQPTPSPCPTILVLHVCRP